MKPLNLMTNRITCSAEAISIVEVIKPTEAPFIYCPSRKNWLGRFVTESWRYYVGYEGDYFSLSREGMSEFKNQ